MRRRQRVEVVGKLGIAIGRGRGGRWRPLAGGFRVSADSRGSRSRLTLAKRGWTVKLWVWRTGVVVRWVVVRLAAARRRSCLLFRQRICSWPKIHLGWCDTWRVWRRLCTPSWSFAYLWLRQFPPEHWCLWNILLCPSWKKLTSS